MSSKLDLSLDDIIKSRPRTRHSRRRSNGARRGGRSQVAKAVQEKPYSRPTPPRIPASSTESGKIIITNLHHNVTERDLRELFCQIGGIKSATLNFDSRGVSQGSGVVVFSRPGDSLTALRKYHGVTLDGRPMKIAIPFTPGSEATVPISSRVGPLNKEPTKKANNRAATQLKPKAKSVSRRRKEAKPVKSKDDLDAELDAYNSAFQKAGMEE